MVPDEQLYHLVRQGDMRAFDTLYGRYEGRLFGFILKMVRNRHDAEDLFHEAFLNVLRSREVNFDHGSFCTWFYRIARNRCLNHLRSGRRKSQAHARIELPPAPCDAEEVLHQNELSHRLGRAVAELPPLLSEVYYLRTSGLSYEEMAAVLGIPLGTVKSRMNQMMNQLKGEVGAWTA